MFSELYLLLMILLTATSNDENKLIKFTAKLLLSVFPDPGHVCYLGDANYAIQFAASLANVAIFNNNCPKVNNRHGWARISGYVMFLEEHTDLGKLFGAALIPQKKVLIVNKGSEFFGKERFTSMSEFRGNAIFLVNNYRVRHGENKVHNLNGPIAIIDVIKEATLFTWNFDFTCYSAGFTRNLSTPRLSDPIRSIEDMLHHPLTNDEGGTLHLLKNSYNKYVRAAGYHLGTRRRSGIPVYGTNILDDYLTRENWVEQIGDLDRYSPMGDCFGRYYLTIALQVNSAFTEVFGRSLQKFHEHGLLAVWMRKTIYEDMGWTWKSLSLMSNAKNGSGGTYKALGWARLQGAFYLLAVGSGCSLIVFIVEMLKFSLNV